MKKLPLGLLALTVLAVGGYGIWWKTSGGMAPGTSKSPVADTTPARPVMAVVAARDIKFAITAAGEIGPLDFVSVRPEVGGLIASLSRVGFYSGSHADRLAEMGRVGPIAPDKECSKKPRAAAT
jgi:hypothetical protein